MILEPLACLAMAIYFEARGEPTVGQIAKHIFYREQ
jgi:spore germination cell wall hydrolase CwlJ-like protein